MPHIIPNPDQEAQPIPEPMSRERLTEAKNLVRYESSISFHSARAKESMLLLVAEVEQWRATYGPDSLRGTLDRLNAAEAERVQLKARVAELEAKLHSIAMVRTWRLETGKKFVFVEDIAPILFDRPGTEAQRNDVRTAMDEALKAGDYEAAVARRQELRAHDDAKEGER